MCDVFFPLAWLATMSTGEEVGLGLWVAKQRPGQNAGRVQCLLPPPGVILISIIQAGRYGTGPNGVSRCGLRASRVWGWRLLKKLRGPEGPPLVL